MIIASLQGVLLIISSVYVTGIIYSYVIQSIITTRFRVY